jgi:Flp pilus assembly protein TadD
VLHRLGRLAQARRLLEQAVEAGELESLLPLSNLLWEEYDDMAGAETMFRRAELESDTNAALNLGLLLLDTRRPGEARAALLRYLEHYPGDRAAARTLEAIDRITGA